MRIGYARVSTDEQSLDLQLDALKRAGCKRIFTDKVSTTKAHHPALAEAVSHLRDRDVLVIWKLDRLGRTVEGLVDFVADLQERKIQFRSLTDGIDTTTPAGRFSFRVMASLAQMERELLAERTRAGLAAARSRADSAARRAAHRGRGRDRLRPHGDALRLRAGTGFPRSHVPVEGDHRGLSSSGRHAGD